MNLGLRTWQQEALDNYQQRLAQGTRISLWEATPGSGKTTAALRVYLHQREALGRRRLIVVTPTTHLKTQWATAAAQVGVQLDSRFRSQPHWAADYDGVVVTYQQVANQPELYRRLSREGVVILDEIHHAATGLLWGDALRQAFEASGFILALSGTAFRSDNAAIPFVRYEDNISIPDYSYAYGRAIEEGVCRTVAFFTYGGQVAWTENDEVFEVDFNDYLQNTTASRRLRAALDPRSGWIQTVLADADKMLLETRRDHPDAGGLLIAADQEHARQLAELLHEVSGTRPVVVLSDDGEASRKIKRFASGHSKWLVACNMVSEGVDIPRLRVGVYATTVTTRLYFRQFLGRIVRVTEQPAGVQVAYCYVPADIRLKILAEQIEAEQRHHLAVQLETVPLEDLPAALHDPQQLWQPLSATNSGLEAVIVNGGQLLLWNDPAYLPQTAGVRQEIERHVAERVALTKTESKTLLAQKIKRLVADCHHQSGQPYHNIHAQLNRLQRVSGQADCTETQLQERIVLLHKMLGRPL